MLINVDKNLALTSGIKVKKNKFNLFIRNSSSCFFGSIFSGWINHLL